MNIDWTKRKVWSSEAIRAEIAAQTPETFWGRTIEIETRRRIIISIAAYAYEFENNPVVTDRDFDRLAQEINPRLGTCHPVLDEFFASRFTPMTGMWIHDHPELDDVERRYREFYERKKS